MNLTALLPEERDPEPVFWRATVVGVDPLRVERDTQGVMGATPDNFAGALRVGDRVFGATISTRSVIFGKAGAIQTIPGNANLNSYVSTGAYHQRSNVNAGSGQNYPVPSAGLLEVHADGQMVYQTFTVYNGSSRFWRTKYWSEWYPWRQIATVVG